MKIQTTCGHGDAHLEGIEGLPIATRIRFQCEDMHLKSCHTVYSNGIYRDRSSKGQRMGRKRFHDCFRAEVRADGVRIRHRFPTRAAAQAWIDSVVSRRS